MTKPTGNPRGRPRGAKNKRTKEREAAMAEAAHVIAQAMPRAFEGDAHALLMAVYKDPDQPMDLRLDAAGKAIRYEKPALSSVDGTGEAVKRAVVRLPPKAETADEWKQLYSPQTRN